MREETAVEALKAGAHDFVVKDRMARLVPAIDRELREAGVRRERRQALADLKLAVQVRDDFLAIASHELRTPLTALDLQVRTALDLAGAATGDGIATKLTAKLAMGMRQVERLKTLIDNLLDVTRLISGSIRLVPRETDLTQILKDVVARMRQGRVEPTEIDVQTDGPALGCWDPVLIEAVVSNLLSNALKFGAGKPVQVRASTHGDLATLVVRDHGIGIDPKDQQRIFERFEKAVSERHYGGFGLGLWVARKAVEAHHGSIRVSSVPGAGSTFVVELSRGRAGG